MTNVATTLQQDITQSILCNGPLTGNLARVLGISLQGCPWRGSLHCLSCEKTPARLCNYQCNSCPDRDWCPCGPRGGVGKKERGA
ncbi:MAG: hypothetical protein H5T62_03395 [Anaerolineae bacterium]|nr:hypothetical protein [Anaerolineae bacterium]